MLCCITSAPSRKQLCAESRVRISKGIPSHRALISEPLGSGHFTKAVVGSVALQPLQFVCGRAWPLGGQCMEWALLDKRVRHQAEWEENRKLLD